MDFDIYVNNTKIDNVASYTSSWYDVSKDSGRDTTTADGTMILNVISMKHRLDITSTYLNNVQLAAFFAQISQSPTMEVRFYDPLTATTQTLTMYRGDRSATIRYSDSNGAMFEPTTIALIEL